MISRIEYVSMLFSSSPAFVDCVRPGDLPLSAYLSHLTILSQ
jgi:hypothetical protein